MHDFLFFKTEMRTPISKTPLSVGLAVATFFAATNPAMAAGKEGVSLKPYVLFEIGGFPITNSMAMSWVISLLIVLLVRSLVGKASLVPSKGQALVEGFVGGIRDLLAPIVGAPAMKYAFPILLSYFTFIVFHNWSGLLPGVGAFGFYDEAGHLTYWMRPGNADLNTVLALSLIHFLAWLFICLKVAGPGMLFHELFGNKADKKETPTVIYWGLVPVFLAVGVIEVISIAFRNVSLSFRLFGNIFGGENLLVSMSNIFSILLPVPFYFYEVLVGMVQALIFTLLVAIYIGLVCNHEGEGAHGH